MAPDLTFYLMSARNALKAKDTAKAIASLIDGINLIGDELDQVNGRLSTLEQEEDAVGQGATMQNAMGSLRMDIDTLQDAVNKLAKKVGKDVL